ncbi:unnamed protein product [Chrysoparadoxa australica]
MKDNEEGAKSLDVHLPEIFPARFTTHAFPCSQTIKDASGIPWGMTTTPYADLRHVAEVGGEIPIENVARCSGCSGYLNAFVQLSRRSWKCPLCGEQTRIRSDLQRYRNSSSMQTLPELNHLVVVYDLPLDSKGSKVDDFMGSAGYLAQEPASARPIVHLAVVDELLSEIGMTAVVDCLQEAIKSLPADTRFGLVSLSDKVGLFDAAAPVPHVQFVNAASKVELCDVLSLQELAAPVGQFRDSLHTAVGSLPQLLRSNTNARRPRRTGAGLQMLMDLVTAAKRPAESGTVQGCQVAGIEVMVFLGAGPDEGVGAISRKGEEVQDHTSMAFYTAMGSSAGASGVTIRIHALAEAADPSTGAAGEAQAHPRLGLTAISPLAMLSSGSVYYHLLQGTAEGKSTGLTHQVVSDVLEPRAYECLLRIRCSEGFTVKRKQRGNCCPDDVHESLWHLASCSESLTVACDFEYTSNGPIKGAGHEGPTVQTAFAYTEVIPDPSDAGKRVTVRRLRVMTAQCDTGFTPQDVGPAIDVPACAFMLTQKVLELIHEREASGEEARELLVTWAVNFVRCSLLGSATPDDAKGLVAAAMLDNFSKDMLRLVYGLVQSDFLGEELIDPDVRAALRTQVSAQEPGVFARTLYPQMQSFSSPDCRVEDCVALTSSEVQQGHIYLVDEGTSGVMYYTAQAAAAAQSQELTPPAGSTLAQYISSRNLMEIKCCRERGPEENTFLRLMLEDMPLAGSSFQEESELPSIGAGFASFLGLVSQALAEEWEIYSAAQKA